MRARLFGLVLISTLLLFSPGQFPSQRGVQAFDAGLSSAPRAALTGVFQQGLNGYTGAADTWISALSWSTPPQYQYNYGQNTLMRLSRSGSEDPLLRFDLSAIPSNSAVTSASLALYNLTPSNCSTNGSLLRRVQAYGILTGWDEGNQVNGVVATTVGAHGATGDYAFLYNSGGTNIPWAGRGMTAGVDYSAALESSADVVNPGWYTWDVTALARAWVHGDQPNQGLVLRDTTGYQEGNCDWRDFASSQYQTDHPAQFGSDARGLFKLCRFIRPLFLGCIYARPVASNTGC